MMKVRKIPMRKCIACQEMKDKKELLRIVINSDKVIEIDTTGKKNGRGAYLCYNQDCLDKAASSRKLESSLKSKIDPSIYEDIAYTIGRHLLLNKDK